MGGESSLWVERWAVCQLLGIPHSTMRSWIRRKHLPGKRERGALLVHLATAQRLADQREQSLRSRTE